MLPRGTNKTKSARIFLRIYFDINHLSKHIDTIFCVIIVNCPRSNMWSSDSYDKQYEAGDYFAGLSQWVHIWDSLPLDFTKCQ